MTARRRARWPLVVLGLAGLVAAMELTVRLAGLVSLDSGIATPHQAAFNASDMFESVGDPVLSYRNRPLARTEVEGVVYRHDERGRRVMPEEAPAGAPAVAFLGDSTTYGLGLAAEDTLPAAVAAELGGALRPLNLGVCGYSTAQEHRLYETELPWLDEARLVVLVFFPNDFAPGVFQWDERLDVMYVDPLPLPRGLKRALWRSALYRWVVSGATARMVARGEFDASNPAHHDEVLGAVERLARRVRDDGRQLVVAHLPAMESLDPYLFEEPVARLARTCERAGVPFVDLLDGFLAERERQIAAWEERNGRPADEAVRRNFLSQYWLVHPSDHHLNAEANRVAARALAPHLRELLPP